MTRFEIIGLPCECIIVDAPPVSVYVASPGLHRGYTSAEAGHEATRAAIRVLQAGRRCWRHVSVRRGPCLSARGQSRPAG